MRPPTIPRLRTGLTIARSITNGALARGARAAVLAVVLACGRDDPTGPELFELLGAWGGGNAVAALEFVLAIPATNNCAGGPDPFFGAVVVLDGTYRDNGTGKSFVVCSLGRWTGTSLEFSLSTETVAGVEQIAYLVGQPLDATTIRATLVISGSDRTALTLRRK